MRSSDSELHPQAVKRLEDYRAAAKRAAVKFWAGLVIALAGVVAVFALQEVTIGFVVALVGAGLVPFERVIEVWRGR